MRTLQKLKSLFRKARWSVGALGRVGAISLGISALALIALSAFLYTLSNNQASHEDDCQELEVLSTAECDRLHGDPAGTLWVIAIGLAVLAGLLALLAALAFRGRDRGPESVESKPIAAAGLTNATTRICPVCSAQAKTSSDTCPHCGSSYIRSRRVRLRRKMGPMSTGSRLVAGAGVLVVLLAIAGGIVAKGYASDRDDEAQELADEEIERQEEEQVAAAAEAAQEQEDLERTSRRLLVQELEKSVTEDAQSTAEESFSIIEGPILATQCDPAGGVIEVAARTQNFDCLAIHGVPPRRTDRGLPILRDSQLRRLQLSLETRRGGVDPGSGRGSRRLGQRDGDRHRRVRLVSVLPAAFSGNGNDDRHGLPPSVSSDLRLELTPDHARLPDLSV